jgi:hypothetical protein
MIVLLPMAVMMLLFEETEVHSSATVAGSGMYLPHLPSLSVSREMSDGSFGCKACQTLQQRVRMVL